MFEVTVLPQDKVPIIVVTLKEVIEILPEKLPWKLNIWIADKLARFGKTTETIIFLAEMNEEPSVEMRLFFEKLIEPLGLPATLYEDWKNKRYHAIRIYNEGNLTINKHTMCYKELPTPVYDAPILTLEELKAKLPKEIPYLYTIWLTGGIVKNGWSANDCDLIIFEEKDKLKLLEVAQFFEEKIGWKTDCGNKIMKEREPVYIFKLYEGGLCQA